MEDSALQLEGQSSGFFPCTIVAVIMKVETTKESKTYQVKFVFKISSFYFIVIFFN